MLDKIPANLIHLDPNSLAQLNPSTTQSTRAWKFDNTELMKQLDKDITSKSKNKKIKLNRHKKLAILDLIKQEKKDNLRRFKNRKIKRKKSRFASKNNIELE